MSGVAAERPGTPRYGVELPKELPGLTEASMEDALLQTLIGAAAAVLGGFVGAWYQSSRTEAIAILFFPTFAGEEASPGKRNRRRTGQALPGCYRRCDQLLSPVRASGPPPANHVLGPLDNRCLKLLAGGDVIVPISGVVDKGDKGVPELLVIHPGVRDVPPDVSRPFVRLGFAQQDRRRDLDRSEAEPPPPDLRGYPLISVQRSRVLGGKPADELLMDDALDIESGGSFAQPGEDSPHLGLVFVWVHVSDIDRIESCEGLSNLIEEPPVVLPHLLTGGGTSLPRLGAPHLLNRLRKLALEEVAGRTAAA